MKSKKFKEVIDKTSPEVKDLVRFNMDVLDRMHELLQKHFEGKQSLLAKKMGKAESEVSKWFTGYQNFTIKSLLALGRAFGEPVIAVCTDKHEDTNYVLVKNNSGHKPTKIHVEPDGHLSVTTEKYTPTTGRNKISSIQTQELA